MREYHKTLYNIKLPEGLTISDSINEQGQFQTSLRFPFATIFIPKKFVFADKLSNWVQRVEKEASS